MSHLDQMPVKRPVWRGDATSLAGKAYKAIEEKIVLLELAPGEIYTEKNLATLVQLGRTPIRDALLRLEHEQLVKVIPRRGIMILPLDFERDLLALDLRAVVERIVVERATRLASVVDRKRLARMADEMERAAEEKDVLAFTRLDAAFHDFVADCAQQPFAAKTLEPLHSLSRRAGTILFRQDFDREIVEASRTHYLLMRAIADGDLARAEAAFDGLIDRARRVTLELAESQGF
jgi:DNA-binding GntR family transcriptional regulator